MPRSALIQTPGGPTPNQVSAALSMLAESTKVVGISIVEFYARRSDAAQYLERLLQAAGLHDGVTAENI